MSRRLLAFLVNLVVRELSGDMSLVGAGGLCCLTWGGSHVGVFISSWVRLALRAVLLDFFLIDLKNDEHTLTVLES